MFICFLLVVSVSAYKNMIDQSHFHKLENAHLYEGCLAGVCIHHHETCSTNNCDRLGDTCDKGFTCCSADNGDCNDGTCWHSNEHVLKRDKVGYCGSILNYSPHRGKMPKRPFIVHKREEVLRRIHNLTSRPQNLSSRPKKLGAWHDVWDVVSDSIEEGLDWLGEQAKKLVKEFEKIDPTEDMNSKDNEVDYRRRLRSTDQEGQQNEEDEEPIFKPRCGDTIEKCAEQAYVHMLKDGKHGRRLSGGENELLDENTQPGTHGADINKALGDNLADQQNYDYSGTITNDDLKSLANNELDGPVGTRRRRLERAFKQVETEMQEHHRKLEERRRLNSRYTATEDMFPDTLGNHFSALVRTILEPVVSNSHDQQARWMFIQSGWCEAFKKIDYDVKFDRFGMSFDIGFDINLGIVAFSYAWTSEYYVYKKSGRWECGWGHGKNLGKDWPDKPWNAVKLGAGLSVSAGVFLGFLVNGRDETAFSGAGTEVTFVLGAEAKFGPFSASGEIELVLGYPYQKPTGPLKAGIVEECMGAQVIFDPTCSVFVENLIGLVGDSLFELGMAFYNGIEAFNYMINVFSDGLDFSDLGAVLDVAWFVLKAGRLMNQFYHVLGMELLFDFPASLDEIFSDLVGFFSGELEWDMWIRQCKDDVRWKCATHSSGDLPIFLDLFVQLSEPGFWYYLVLANPRFNLLPWVINSGLVWNFADMNYVQINFNLGLGVSTGPSSFKEIKVAPVIENTVENGYNTHYDCGVGKIFDWDSVDGSNFVWSDNTPRCTKCSHGQYALEMKQSMEDYKECKTCGKGKYAPDNEQKCETCPSGYYSDLNSNIMYNCYACGEGQEIVNNACVDCQPGKYHEIAQYEECTYPDCKKICETMDYDEYLTYNNIANHRKDCNFSNFNPDIHDEAVRTGKCSQEYRVLVARTNTAPKWCIYGDTIIGSDICKHCDRVVSNSTVSNSTHNSTVSNSTHDCKYYYGVLCTYTGQRTSLKNSINVIGNTTINYGLGGDCTYCPAGWVQPSARQSSCTACEAGQYQPNYNRTWCKMCLAGYFQDVKNSTECKECPAGYFADVQGLNICKHCPEGWFQNQNRKFDCKHCPVGRFGKFDRRVASSRDGACEECPAGYFQNEEKSISCKECSAGYFENVTESPRCKDCKCGKYQENPGQTYCTDCKAGYFNSNTKGTSKTACILTPPGGYDNETGSCGRSQTLSRRRLLGNSQQTNTLSCPVGKYGDERGMTNIMQCKTCPPGFYNEFTWRESSADCLQCVPGKYQNTSGQAYCDNCPAGQFNSRTAQSACQHCAHGKWTYFDKYDDTNYEDGDGKTSGSECIECKPGTEAKWDPSYRCVQCNNTGLDQTNADDNRQMKMKFMPGNEQQCTTCPSGFVWQSVHEPCKPLQACNTASDISEVSGICGCGCVNQTFGTAEPVERCEDLCVMPYQHCKLFESRRRCANIPMCQYTKAKFQNTEICFCHGTKCADNQYCLIEKNVGVCRDTPRINPREPKGYPILKQGDSLPTDVYHISDSATCQEAVKVLSKYRQVYGTVATGTDSPGCYVRTENAFIFSETHNQYRYKTVFKPYFNPSSQGNCTAEKCVGIVADACNSDNSVNSKTCVCNGTSVCTPYSGLKCFENTGQCGIDVCSNTDGTQKNLASCKCGETTCSEESICYLDGDLGICRTEGLGQYGYKFVNSDKCSTINMTTLTRPQCEAAAVRLGLEFRGDERNEYTDAPSGCFYSSYSSPRTIWWNAQSSTPNDRTCKGGITQGSWFAGGCVCLTENLPVGPPQCSIIDGSNYNSEDCTCERHSNQTITTVLDKWPKTCGDRDGDGTGTLYDCGSTHYLKQDYAEIYCQDGCSQSICCSARATCPGDICGNYEKIYGNANSQYHPERFKCTANCDAKYYKKKVNNNDKTIYCDNPAGCDRNTNQRDKCCDKYPTCAQQTDGTPFPCPDGTRLLEDNDCDITSIHWPETGPTFACTLEDCCEATTTCNDIDGRGSQYECGTNYRLRENAEYIPCEDAPCSSDDFDTCCEGEITCGNHDGQGNDYICNGDDASGETWTSGDNLIKFVFDARYRSRPCPNGQCTVKTCCNMFWTCADFSGTGQDLFGVNGKNFCPDKNPRFYDGIKIADIPVIGTSASYSYASEQSRCCFDGLNTCGCINANGLQSAETCQRFQCACGLQTDGTSRNSATGTCDACHAGTWAASGTDDCSQWTGQCTNGDLIAEAQRTQENHCGTCNSGYYLNDKTCLQCTQCADNQKETTACEGTTNRGCTVYAGVCTNGTLIAETQRTQENHCGTCDSEYYLNDKTCEECTQCADNQKETSACGGTTNRNCTVYVGVCTNGDLIAEAQRRQDNHCGTCNSGYYLNDKTCEECTQCADNQRETTACEGTTNRGCTVYAGVCTNGTLIAEAERRQDNHCGTCNSGYGLSNRNCELCTDINQHNNFNDATPCGNCSEHSTPHSSGRYCQCDIGYYGTAAQVYLQNGQTVGTCSQCENGTFTAAIGSTTCTPKTTTCPAGEYLSVSSDATADNRCNACQSGRYKSGNNSATSCTPKTVTTCPAGEYLSVSSDATDDSICHDCPSGWYKSGNNNATSCTPKTQPTCVDAGKQFKETNNTEDNRCDDCPSGFYKEENGENVKCGPKRQGCGAGDFLNITLSTTENHNCAECPPGKFKAGDLTNELIADCYRCDNATECNNCPAGKFGKYYGQVDSTRCYDCPQGWVAPEGTGYKDTYNYGEDDPTYTSENYPGCTQCPSGYTSGTDGETCVCAKGTYLDGATCWPCPDGQTTDTAGKTSASDCVDVSTSLCSYDYVIQIMGMSMTCSAAYSQAIGFGMDSSEFCQQAGQKAQENCPICGCTSSRRRLAHKRRLQAITCNATQIYNGTHCEECPENKIPNNNACDACPTGRYRPVGAPACLEKQLVLRPYDDTLGVSAENCCFQPTCANVVGRSWSATHANFDCPAGYTKKVDFDTATCPSGKCYKEDCCVMKTCANEPYDACPEGLRNRNHSHRIPCPSGTCTDRMCCEIDDATPAPSDSATCIDTDGDGSNITFYCLSDTILVRNATCASVTCTEADRGTCCTPRPTCGSVAQTCPNGTNPIVGQDSIVLTGVFNDTCCESLATCANTDGKSGLRYQCPTHKTLIANPQDTQCAGDCSDARCCTNKGTCDNFPVDCPSDYTKVVATCEGIRCRYDECCQPTNPTCAGFTCAANYNLVNANNCSGVCTHEECCTPTGTSCADYSCPGGKALRAHPEKWSRGIDPDTNCCVTGILEGACSATTEGFPESGLYCTIKGGISACDAGCNVGTEFNPDSQECDTCLIGRTSLATETCTDVINDIINAKNLATLDKLKMQNTVTLNDKYHLDDICKLGEYENAAPSGSALRDCVKCPMAKYGDEIGLRTCKECPEGQTTFSIGSAHVEECIQCEPGRFLPQNEQNSLDKTCNTCPGGWYQDVYGERQCKRCPSGRFTFGVGSTSVAACETCGAGTYLVNKICLNCPSGWYKPADDNTVCIACESGKYQPTQKSASCILCEYGKYSDETHRTTACMDCQLGKYNNLLGQTVCKYCPTGKYSAEGAVQSVDCTICTDFDTTLFDVSVGQYTRSSHGSSNRPLTGQTYTVSGANDIWWAVRLRTPQSTFTIQFDSPQNNISVWAANAWPYNQVAWNHHSWSSAVILECGGARDSKIRACSFETPQEYVLLRPHNTREFSLGNVSVGVYSCLNGPGGFTSEYFQYDFGKMVTINTPGNTSEDGTTYTNTTSDKRARYIRLYQPASDVTISSSEGDIGWVLKSESEYRINKSYGCPADDLNVGWSTIPTEECETVRYALDDTAANCDNICNKWENNGERRNATKYYIGAGVCQAVYKTFNRYYGEYSQYYGYDGQEYPIFYYTPPYVWKQESSVYQCEQDTLKKKGSAFSMYTQSSTEYCLIFEPNVNTKTDNAYSDSAAPGLDSGQYLVGNDPRGGAFGRERRQPVYGKGTWGLRDVIGYWTRAWNGYDTLVDIDPGGGSYNRIRHNVETSGSHCFLMIDPIDACDSGCQNGCYDYQLPDGHCPQ